MFKYRDELGWDGFRIDINFYRKGGKNFFSGLCSLAAAHKLN